jgi:hypothetical protein
MKGVFGQKNEKFHSRCNKRFAATNILFLVCWLRSTFSLSPFRCVASENSCFYAARHPIRPVVALHCTFACFCRIKPTVTIYNYNKRFGLAGPKAIRLRATGSEG